MADRLESLVHRLLSALFLLSVELRHVDQLPKLRRDGV
jgi:hypothetical protein